MRKATKWILYAIITSIILLFAYLLFVWKDMASQKPISWNTNRIFSASENTLWVDICNLNEFSWERQKSYHEKSAIYYFEKWYSWLNTLLVSDKVARNRIKGISIKLYLRTFWSDINTCKYSIQALHESANFWKEKDWISITNKSVSKRFPPSDISEMILNIIDDTQENAISDIVSDEDNFELISTFFDHLTRWQRSLAYSKISSWVDSFDEFVDIFEISSETHIYHDLTRKKIDGSYYAQLSISKNNIQKKKYILELSVQDQEILRESIQEADTFPTKDQIVLDNAIQYSIEYSWNNKETVSVVQSTSTWNTIIDTITHSLEYNSVTRWSFSLIDYNKENNWLEYALNGREYGDTRLYNSNLDKIIILPYSKNHWKSIDEKHYYHCLEDGMIAGLVRVYSLQTREIVKEISWNITRCWYYDETKNTFLYELDNESQVIDFNTMEQ